MPVLDIVLREPAWPDLKDKPFVHVTSPIGITALSGGMESGATAVMLRLDLPDGTVVIAETSLALLVMAVSAFRENMPSPPGVGENAP